MKNIPKKHLFKHTVGSGHTGQPACGEGVQLQVGRNDLSCHLCVSSCSSTTATGRTSQLHSSVKYKAYVKGLDTLLNNMFFT